MGQVMFYHLTRSTAVDTMGRLLPRALKAGWPVMLRGTDRTALERLDAQLWQGAETGFLPHGLEGGPHDALQPVLLGQGGIANGARALMLVDGADTTPDEAAALERVFVLFDGADTASVARARQQWVALTAAGLPAEYWAEEDGGWTKKAEKKA